MRWTQCVASVSFSFTSDSVRTAPSTRAFPRTRGGALAEAGENPDRRGDPPILSKRHASGTACVPDWMTKAARQVTSGTSTCT